MQTCPNKKRWQHYIELNRVGSSKQTNRNHEFSSSNSIPNTDSFTCKNWNRITCIVQTDICEQLLLIKSLKLYLAVHINNSLPASEFTIRVGKMLTNIDENNIQSMQMGSYDGYRATSFIHTHDNSSSQSTINMFHK